jgi:plasmid stabilization system protein ParE
MIVLSPDAIEDIERLRSFLEQKSPDAAQRAMTAIFAAIERLTEFPDLGMSTGDADIPPNRDPVRRIRLHRPLCGNGRERGYSHHQDLARPRDTGLARRRVG